MSRRWSIRLRWSGLILLVLVAAILIADMRKSVRTAMCLGNINQINLAVRMYAEDHDERLPAPANWMDRCFAYAKNWDLFRCPEIPVGHGFGYSMNTGESVFSKIADPHDYPLIFETGDLQKSAHGPYARLLVNPSRHSNGTIWIGYADGRGRAIKRPQMK